MSVNVSTIRTVQRGMMLKLKSLPDAKSHLKDNTRFDELDRIAYAMSDLDAVRRVNDARRDVFHTIDLAPPHAAW